MSTWEGKTRGGVLGYKIFVFLLKHFGVRAAYMLLIFVAFYFVIFAPKPSRHIFNYFHKTLQYGFFSSLVNIYRNYILLGQTIIDKVAVMAGFSNQFTYHFDGENHLQDMVDQETGGVLISAHLGNWEIAGHFLQRLNGKINIVMFDAEHQQIKKYLSDIDFERKVNIIVVKDDLSHIFQISKALQNKELICMHGDRFVEGGKTKSVDFFGKKAPLPVGPFEIATKFKVPYSFVFALKETSKHYHFFASPGKVNEGSAEDLMKKYAQNLEKMVNRYPLQWFNYYDFWEKQPEN